MDEGPSRSYPIARMRIAYVPGSSRARGNAYRPCASVATVTVTVEPARFALTSTPSICASCCELTTPVSAAVEDWASVRSMNVKTSAAPARTAATATMCLERMCITFSGMDHDGHDDHDREIRDRRAWLLGS